jgi:hypothetical protein
VAGGLHVVADDPGSVGLERLGASDAFAGVLLEILREHGWEAELTQPFAGSGFLAIARSPFGYEFVREGETRSGAALAVFGEVARIMSVGGQFQLRLPL